MRSLITDPWARALRAAVGRRGCRFRSALWLESRRIWHRRRWQHPFLNDGTIIYPGLEDRDDCLSIGGSECQTNPNVECG